MSHSHRLIVIGGGAGNMLTDQEQLNIRALGARVRVASPRLH